MTSHRGPLRLVRGGTAASLVTLLALGGHLVGGAPMPSWLGVALPWWLSVTVCTVLAGSRFTLPRMGTAVLTSQALFHGLFVVGTPGDPSTVLVPPPGSHLGHGRHGSGGAGHAAEHTGHGADGMAAAAQHALHAGHSDSRMLLWHLVAGLLTTVLLHRGESILLRCAGLVGAMLAVLARPPRGLTLPSLPLPGPSRPVLPSTLVRPRRRAVLDPRLQRGPPVILAA